MKLMLYGGTFDPVHNGHVKVAQSAFEKLGCDKAFFIPARRSPHRSQSPLASGTDRVAMLKLALADMPCFEVSDCELKRPEPSYAYDTIKDFAAAYQNAELFWIVGADALTDLLNWHKIAQIIDICNLCLMYRAGYQKPEFQGFEDQLGPERTQKLRNNVIPGPLIDISSTEIRAKLLQNRQCPDLIDPRVMQYIRNKGLYGFKS